MPLTSRHNAPIMILPALILMVVAIAGIAAAAVPGDNDGSAMARSNGNGIVLLNSSGNTLNGNTASGNAMSGFMLESSDNNTLTKNTASGNRYGITLANGSGNIIAGNNVTGNFDANIRITNGSRDNLLYDNDPGNGGNVGPGQAGIGNALNHSLPREGNGSGGRQAGDRIGTVRDGTGFFGFGMDLRDLFAPLLHIFGSGDGTGRFSPAPNDTVQAVQSFTIR